MNRTVAVAVIGAGGRMGQRIIAQAQDPALGARITGAIERPGHPDLGRDAGELAGVGKLELPLGPDLAAALAEADVVIDFSHPDTSVAAAEQVARAGKAIVIGTTGLAEFQIGRVKVAAKSAPVVLSPNMSVGVNLMFKVLAEIARVTGDDYDVEIIEVHHRHKKDAPSGTALKLAEVVAQALGRDLKRVGVFARHGMVGARKPEEIGIQSIRAGDVVGDHTVIFGGPGERLELTHRAHSRDNFARGALIAARWVAGRPAGFYDMQDVLGLRSLTP
jgi:4-hydroxy-tetrahydrodipicolinate reductase